jgi:hypothetical protein
MWKDVGIMNSSGKVVCLDCDTLFRVMNQGAPLMAGLVYYTSAKRTTEQDRRM